jgi:hypothetical protein
VSASAEGLRKPLVSTAISIIVLVVLVLVLDRAAPAPDPGDRVGGGAVFQMRPGEARHFSPGAIFENDRMACHEGPPYLLWQGAGHSLMAGGIEIRTNEDGSVDAICPATFAQA